MICFLSNWQKAHPTHNDQITMNVSNKDTASASLTTNEKYARIMNQLDNLKEERARIANELKDAEDSIDDVIDHIMQETSRPSSANSWFAWLWRRK